MQCKDLQLIHDEQIERKTLVFSGRMLPIDVYKQIVAKNGPTTLGHTGTSYTDTHTYGAYCTALNNCLWYPKVGERNWRKEMPSIRQFVACLLLLLFSFVGVVVTVTQTHTHINTRTRSRHSSSYSSIPSTSWDPRAKTKQNKRRETRREKQEETIDYSAMCRVRSYVESSLCPSPVCCDSLAGLNCWQSN